MGGPRKEGGRGGGRRLRRSGGYRKLQSFQVATLIYDGTVSFCHRFVDRRSRTHDQMVQAARSGRQNIAEGNRAGASSSKSELHLTNVARGSLDELLLDYEDYLRQRQLPLWEKDGSEALTVRRLGRSMGRASGFDQSDRTDRSDQKDLTDPTDAGDRARWRFYGRWLEHEDPAVRANTLICLIHQANYLLDRQLVSLEQEFVEDGGYSEQLAAARIAHREEQRRPQSDPSDQTDQTDRSDRSDQNFPLCPLCGRLMVLRTARRGGNAGSHFLGCTGYPECKGTSPTA